MVRWKKRYYILSVEYFEKEKVLLNPKSIKSAILLSVKKLFGDFGSATVESGFQIKHCNSETGILYVRVNRSTSPMVTAALPLITKIDNESAKVSCIHASATMRHAHLNLKKYHEKHLRQERTIPPAKVKLNRREKIIRKRKSRVN